MIWKVLSIILIGVVLFSTTKSLIAYRKRIKEEKKHYGRYYSHDDDITFGWWCFLNISITIVVLMLASMGEFLSGVAIWNYLPETHGYYEQVDFEVVAFKDNIGMQGQVFLTGGRFEDNLYYFYLRDTSMGLTQGKMRADHTYIEYTDETPHIVYYEDRFHDLDWLKIFVTLDSIKDMYWGNYYYKAYLPYGSVEENYYIDLE